MEIFSKRKREHAKKGVVTKICDVFAPDWSNFAFHIHDHADPRCCLSVRDVRRRVKM